MLKELALANAYRVTPTGLYLISTAYQGKRNVQFAFRAIGIADEPPLLVIGIQDKNFSREVIQKSREFVINVCSKNQLHAVDKSRDLSGRDVEDKFAALGLEPCRRNMCNRRWWPGATPMSNASSSMKCSSRDCTCLSARRSLPISTIKFNRLADWRVRAFSSINRSNKPSRGTR